MILTVLQIRAIIYSLAILTLMVKNDANLVNILKIVVLFVLISYYYFCIYTKEKKSKNLINHYRIPDFLFLICSVSQVFKLALLQIN
ncbi:Uncharacterised protein [Sphingobacterium thalpophilum]|uniref:Uncharacterized protein n=1 Tax=Sphingobacterium thalpophilum TaxID=259 RepID=A0A4U9VRQ0_9SPHI|nr:Uncharacterised protein [Sphingobacterium thalpophilum]